MFEIIPIVDEFDHIIGSVEKEKFDKTSGQIYRTVSLYLFDKTGKMLIQRRAFSKKTYAGKWDFAAAAGHVSFGESYLEAIRRETDEELGLTGLNFFEGEKEFTETAEGKRRFNQVFWAIEDFMIQDLILPKNEVSEVCLVDISDIQDMFQNNPNDFANYNGSGFEQTAERISKIAKQMSNMTN